ncbi:FMN-binding protein [Planotetraspora sp. GP83]|uniref:FMN-binding protein n=1 Tax=Planotetraspora sp. GP83 TaxID=3156264 RepID=UPI0035166216
MKRAVLALLTTIAGVALIVTHRTTPMPPAGMTRTTSSKTVTGDPADTGHGMIAVTLTLSGRRITRAAAVQHATSPRSRQVSARAIARLDQEVLTAQNAHVDTISGATMTSDGYRRSLQSALDRSARPR